MGLRSFGWFSRRSWASEMEIEAKFRAPDADLLYRLGEATHLASYPIFAGRTEQLSDTYLDTEQWQMLTAGYACRRRLVGDRILITVKRVRSAEDAANLADAVHRREELEVDLPADVPASGWPESEARARVLEVIGDQPLVERLSLRQTRSTRWVGTIDRPLVEISLDEVQLEPSGDRLSRSGTGAHGGRYRRRPGRPGGRTTNRLEVGARAPIEVREGPRGLRTGSCP